MGMDHAVYRCSLHRPHVYDVLISSVTSFAALVGIGLSLDCNAYGTGLLKLNNQLNYVPLQSAEHFE